MLIIKTLTFGLFTKCLLPSFFQTIYTIQNNGYISIKPSHTKQPFVFINRSNMLQNSKPKQSRSNLSKTDKAKQKSIIRDKTKTKCKHKTDMYKKVITIRANKCCIMITNLWEYSLRSLIFFKAAKCFVSILGPVKYCTTKSLKKRKEENIS